MLDFGVAPLNAAHDAEMRILGVGRELDVIKNVMPVVALRERESHFLRHGAEAFLDQAKLPGIRCRDTRRVIYVAREDPLHKNVRAETDVLHVGVVAVQVNRQDVMKV